MAGCATRGSRKPVQVKAVSTSCLPPNCEPSKTQSAWPKHRGRECAKDRFASESSHSRGSPPSLGHSFSRNQRGYSALVPHFTCHDGLLSTGVGQCSSNTSV